MCNPRHCVDLHAIKTISDDPGRSTSVKEVPNTYDWATHKTSPFFIPSNYSSQYFSDRWFWKPTDPHDYSNSTLIKGIIHPFAQFATSGRDGNGYIETV